jgi:histidine triad (HIT) family protein
MPNTQAVDEGCVFCKIVKREIPAEILHVSDNVVAFRDLNPQAPTHILLIPKEHIVSVADIEDRHGDMLADMMQAATHLARADGIDRTGFRLVSNTGPESGQEVFHLHFHLLGGREMGWPPG